MDQIKKGIDFSIDPHQYAYKRNRCTADTISYVVHLALTHLENRDSFVRLLFLDFCSAFNTIILQILVHKLEALRLSPALCNWVLDFLTNRRQTVRIHSVTSSPIILNTGSPHSAIRTFTEADSNRQGRRISSESSACENKIPSGDQKSLSKESNKICSERNACKSSQNVCSLWQGPMA